MGVITMRKRDLFLTLLVAFTPIGAIAQDDMYFGSDSKAQKADKAKVEAYEQQEREFYNNYPGRVRDVDEYNRYGRLHSYYQKIGKDSLGNDIIQFQAGDGQYPDSIITNNGNDEDYQYSRRLGRYDDFYGWYDPYFYSYRNPWRWGWYDPWYYDYWYDPWFYDSWYGYGWGWPYYGYYGYGWPYYRGYWGGWWGPTYYGYRNGGNLGGPHAYNGRIAHGGNGAFDGRGDRSFGGSGHSYGAIRRSAGNNSTYDGTRGFRGSRANYGSSLNSQPSRVREYTPSQSYSAPTRSFSGGSFSGGSHSFSGGGGGGFSGGGGHSFGGGGGRIGGHR